MVHLWMKSLSILEFVMWEMESTEVRETSLVLGTVPLDLQKNAQ